MAVVHVLQAVENQGSLVYNLLTHDFAEGGCARIRICDFLRVFPSGTLINVLVAQFLDGYIGQRIGGTVGRINGIADGIRGGAGDADADGRLNGFSLRLLRKWNAALLVAFSPKSIRNVARDGRHLNLLGLSSVWPEKLRLEN